jgi:hypothetical protein
MPPAIYSCTLWRDHGSFFGGPKRVDVFDTGLDLEDPASLEHALAAAVRRHPSFPDIEQYSLQNRRPGEHEVILDYRHTPWLYDQQT